MGLDERYPAPPLINLVCGEGPIQKQRRKIVPRAEGVALELGFGAGLNLLHFDRAKGVTKLFALGADGGSAVADLETMRLPGEPGWAGFNDWGAARPR